MRPPDLEAAQAENAALRRQVRELEDELAEVYAQRGAGLADLVSEAADLSAALGLRPREAQILKVLKDRGGHVVPKAALFDLLIGDSAASPKLIDVHVCLLRRHLRQGGWPIAIETVHAIGYRLAPAHAAFIRAVLATAAAA